MRVEKLEVRPEDSLIAVLNAISQAKSFDLPSGIALVTDENRRLLGTVTDGDIRRHLETKQTLEATAAEVMNADPIVFDQHLPADRIWHQLPRELEARGRHSTHFLGKIILVDEARRVVSVRNYHHVWEQHVAIHRHIVVVGLGYVGLTLALAFAARGFRVSGFDTDRNKIETLRAHKSYVHEIGLPELVRETVGKTFFPTETLPEEGDIFVISVGTPVSREDGGHRLELDGLEQAARAVGQRLRSGNLVVLRSTVPVNCTRNHVLPILESESGLNAGFDFHLSFAPERTIEGNALAELRSLPQIVGGLNADSTEATAALFRELTPTVVRVESLEAAELAKLTNNAFRDLIFAFANQMAQLSRAFNIDTREVIKAANLGYPRDPVPLPSPGVGGACLTKDPYIIDLVAKQAGLDTTLFRLGREVNEAMHDHVVEALAGALARSGKSLEGARVLICGLAFKGHPETADLRNSSSIDVAHLLAARGVELAGYDPVASDDEIRDAGLSPLGLEEGAEGADALLFMNNHRSFRALDVSSLIDRMAPCPVIFDGWGLFSARELLAAGPLTYVGLGFQVSSLENAAAERPA